MYTEFIVYLIITNSLLNVFISWLHTKYCDGKKRRGKKYREREGEREKVQVAVGKRYVVDIRH